MRVTQLGTVGGVRQVLDKNVLLMSTLLVMDNQPADNQFFNIEVRTIPLPLIAVHQSWPGSTPAEALAKFKRYLEENSKSGAIQDNSPLGVSLKALESNRIADYVVKDKEGKIIFQEQVNPDLLFPY